jgi:DNA-binding SARP family transcriptional activator
MKFLILGPLEAYDGDRRLSLGGPRQRALLAMLLLHANEVVSSDKLVDVLWGEAGTEDGAKALSVAVSRLRRLTRAGTAARRGGASARHASAGLRVEAPGRRARYASL